VAEATPASVTSSTFEGSLTKIDATKRTFVVKESAASMLQFSYDDSTAFHRPAGGGLQQPLKNFGDRLPFKLTNKVRVSWKMDGTKRTAIKIIMVE
jgi:hypothetical protein